MTLTVPESSRPAGVTAAVVIGSIAPDVDAPLAFYRFDIYLRAHATGTHSLIGSCIVAALLAALLRGVVRGSRFTTLLLASCVGVAGHLVCDLGYGSDIRLFQPVSDEFFGWHLFSMADPIAPVTLLPAIAAAWMWRRHARAIALCALIGLVSLAAVKSQTQRLAVTRYRQSVAAPAAAPIEIDPHFTLSDWTIYDRAGARVRSWRVNAWSGDPLLDFERQDAIEALAGASRSLPVVDTFLRVARIPFARIDSDGGRTAVLWSDVRWCVAARCDVSFGGVFEAGVPAYQLIRIGGFRQVRSLPH